MGHEIAAMSKGACQRPVFVIGCPRSGTSVLAWALASHPEFWTSGETDFFYHLFGRGRLHEMWLECKGGIEGSWLARNHVARQEFAAALGLGLNVLLTTRSGGLRWVDQSPTYTMLTDELSMLVPDAQFIHIIRDGRSVVHSMVNSGFDVDWAKDFATACRAWAWYVEQGTTFGERAPDRYLAVVHRFLAESPEACFRVIFDFLDVESSEHPARFVSSRHINSSFERAADGRPAAPLAEPWTQWTAEQRAIFRREAGEAFVEYGFGTEQDLAA